MDGAESQEYCVPAFRIPDAHSLGHGNQGPVTLTLDFRIRQRP